MRWLTICIWEGVGVGGGVGAGAKYFFLPQPVANKGIRIMTNSKSDFRILLTSS